MNIYSQFVMEIDCNGNVISPGVLLSWLRMLHNGWPAMINMIDDMFMSDENSKNPVKMQFKH